MPRNLDRGVYALASEAFRANYLPFVGIALVQAALQAVSPLLAAGGGASLPAAAEVLASLLQIPLLYLALVTMMQGRPWEGGTALPRGFWRFAARFLLLALPPALVVALVREPAAGLALLLLVSIGAMGLFGTVLPDVAAGGSGRFSDAWTRGRRTFAAFIMWMLQGPAAVLFGLGVTIAVISAILMMTGIGVRIGPDDQLVMAPWFGGLVAILGALGGSYVTALTAATLAKAWQRGGGAAP